jgi:hypothetical protein
LLANSSFRLTIKNTCIVDASQLHQDPTSYIVATKIN